MGVSCILKTEHESPVKYDSLINKLIDLICKHESPCYRVTQKGMNKARGSIRLKH